MKERELGHGDLKDITAPKVVQIEIRNDGSVLWVNVDGKCALRCCRIGELTIKDNRPKTKRRRR